VEHSAKFQVEKNEYVNKSARKTVKISEVHCINLVMFYHSQFTSYSTENWSFQRHP